MKNTIKELANETTTSEASTAGVQGTQWLKEILKTAQQKMYFEQFAYVSKTNKGDKDLEVPISTSNKSFSNSKSEAQTRTMTAIDNVSTKTFTPSSDNLGATISKENVQTSRVDYVKFAREQMAYDAALKIDSAIATAIEDADSPAATLYGGDATGTGELSSGDTMTTDLVAKGQRYLKANGWVSENGSPFVLFIPAVAEEQFLKSSQFVNAAEYGSDDVVNNGEIGRYLGVRVVVTEQCPSHSDWGSGSLDGHSCFLIKSKVSYGIVYREQPTLDSEYLKNEAAYNIYLDMAYDANTLQENAIVIFKVADE